MEDNEQASPLSPLPRTEKMVAIAIGAGEDAEDPAKILASGRGKLAEAILAIAFERGIKVRTDADLAELLAQLEMDSPIPTEAVVAVAEILAKVYEANSAASTPISTERLLAK
jgi:flagellar biosynthesis protein